MIDPVPDVSPVLPEDAALAVYEAGGAAATVAVLPAAADPPAMGATEPVPFCAMAICSNMAWVLLAVGLIEKVIPFPQWPDCLQ